MVVRQEGRVSAWASLYLGFELESDQAAQEVRDFEE
jgi:hypothetical protein